MSYDEADFCTCDNCGTGIEGQGIMILYVSVKSAQARERTEEGSAQYQSLLNIR